MAPASIDIVPNSFSYNVKTGVSNVRYISTNGTYYIIGANRKHKVWVIEHTKHNAHNMSDEKAAAFVKKHCSDDILEHLFYLADLTE